MTDELILERVKVDCHGEITGKVQTDDDAYVFLLAEMQDHFSNDQVVSVITYIPRVGELCAGSLNGNWYRVKVVNKLSGGRTGCIVTCLFVDEGLETTIPISGLKHLPPKFSELPFLVKNVHLFGIQPYSMKVSPEDLSIYHGPKKLWDEAAVKYIEDNISAATQVRCTVMETYADGTLSVRMFLRTRSGGMFCLNELLVNKQYAIGTEKTEEMKKVLPQTSESLEADIQRVFRKRRTSNKHNPQDVAVKSDTEYYSRTSVHGERGDFSDREYLTDTQGISAISHRRFHQAPVKHATEMCQQNELYETDSVSSLQGLNTRSYSGSHMEIMDASGDSKKVEVKRILQEEINLSDALYKSGIDTSPSRRMRGVRGSHFSHNEIVKKQIETRRQIILNQLYGETFDNETILKESPRGNPKITTPPKEYSSDENSLSFFKGRGSPSYGGAAPVTPPKENSPDENSLSILKGRGSPSYGRVTQPKENSSDENSLSFLQGRGSLSYGRGAALTSDFVGRATPVTLPEEKSSDGNNLSFFKGRGSPSYGRVTPPKENSSDENSLSFLQGRGSPSYGRGAALTSDLVGRLRSPSNASVCSETSSVNMIPKGRGAILLNRLSSESISPVGRRIQSLAWENSDSESLFGGRSGADSLSARIRSVSDMESCTESESGALTRNERRHQAKVRGVNININSAMVSKKLEVQSKPENTNFLSLLNSRNRFSSVESIQGRASHDILSGNETAVSEKSILAASAKGQAQFKAVRLPKGSSVKGNKSRSDVGEKFTIDSTQAAASSGAGCLSPPEVSDPVCSGASSDERLVHNSAIADNLQPVLLDNSAVIEKIQAAEPKASSPSKRRPAVIESGNDRLLGQPVSRQSLQGQNMCLNEGAMASERHENGSTHTAVGMDAKSKMIGEMEGKMMLSNLVQRSTRSSLPTSQEAGFSVLCHEVLVHGSKPPKPVYRIEKARFTDHVALRFAGQRYPDLTLAQAYSWPVITRGQHVITVSPPGGGKTLAYLCPLISALGDPKVYHQVINNGRGPLVIILSFTWRRAKFVYSEALELIGSRGDKVILVHGGAQMEEQKACELLNGCEILIATPPSLSRILEAGYTDLRRLCHLVVDDADQTLSSFKNEIGNLIKMYDLVIKNEMKNLGCPRQILCFGAQWNSAINGFMLSNLIEPVLIITSPFESAIYGQVKQVTHMCKKADRLKEVLGILENLPDDSSHPVLIFASVKRDILMLYKTLNTSSRFCLMVHEDMDTFEVDRIAEQWPVPLLVCWDEHTAKMKITDATAVIHYDMPPSKTKFSNRLCCMRQYFHDFSKANQPSIKPTSHIIITEDCLKQLKSLNNLLMRLDCERPAELKAFVAGMLEEREENERLELCTQTLAFGTCRDLTRCSSRHRIIPECDTFVESDWLPDEGEVKVMVTHVVDASHYYIRMLGVKREGMTGYEDLSLRFIKMQLELAQWYSNLHNKKRYAPDITEEAGYEIGEVCGYEENEVFYRVQIFDVRKRLENAAVPVIEATVKFVDSGRMKNIPAYKLYVLPQHLRDLPYQAVEVFVCKVRPVDKDTEWTEKANIFIHESLIGKELVGNILLRIGYILWLDPLLYRKYLPESHSVSHQFYVQEELVRNKFADENKTHLQKLYKLCEGKIYIPKALLKKSKMTPTLDTDVLPATRTRHEVYLSSVGTPDLFYVQRKEKQEDLQTLMDDINTFVEKNDIYVDIGQELKCGKFCLAQYTNFDNRWYRAKILEMKENSFEVFFADYGDKDCVPKDKVREMPFDQFYELPLQAIECQLSDIRPVGEDWDKTVGDVLWDLTHYVNFDMRNVTAVVRGKVPANYGGNHKFVVDLSTRSGSCDLSIAEELSWQQLALPVEGSNIEPLFPRPSRLRMKMYRSLAEKVPDLCSSLYWEQIENKSIKLSEEIYGILSNSLTRSVDSTALLCVSSLVKLIGRVRWDSVHQGVMNCILCIAQTNEMFCDALINENCVPSVIRCLELNSNPVLQEQAADFVAKVANISSRFKTYFQLRENVQVLFELLGSTEDDLVQGGVCRAFAALCSGSERVYDYLMDKSVCQKLVKCLLNTGEHDVAEGILSLIAVLAEHDSGHEDLKKESLIESIVKNLSKTNCNKCIQYSVQQCDYFASTRRKHKTFLLEQQMVPILTRILQLDLQSATKQLCQDLLTSLVIKVPSEPMIGTTFRPEQPGLAISTDSVPPEVKWSQNTFRVVLKVVVANVTGSPLDVVKFTSKSVKFRATVDGLHYAFNYRLFDSIIVEKSTVEIGTGVVAISMKKLTEGKWSRLLHDKVKPTNLSVDFENWVDSSSDSEVCDDEQPFLLKKKQRGSKGLKISGAQAGRLQVEIREETDTSDSLENTEDRDDRDLFENFL